MGKLSTGVEGVTLVRSPAVHVHQGIGVRVSGAINAPLDIWFHPAFGDSQLSYRGVLASDLCEVARIIVFDPPGHGASPPRPQGLTIAGAAHLWCELIKHFSRSRQVALVGHSMAGIIASRTAGFMSRQPVLVIGVEANLVPQDAYFTGLATRFDDPADFFAAFRQQILRIARRDAAARRFACALESADPLTLWKLGRSVSAQKDPGSAFRRLRCPKVHYWDFTNSSRAARDYVFRHRLPHRRLDHLGHWPMIKAPGTFCSAIASDVRDAMPAKRPRFTPDGP
jgi:hypothetical protein